jgi:hypothetical protein
LATTKEEMKMSQRTGKEKIIRKGSWVEIHKIVLKPGERAPQVPEDTQKVPLELKARGFLVQDARLGDQVTVETVIGRKLSGTLCDESPSYTHSFGPPHPELLPIGSEVRAILKEED